MFARTGVLFAVLILMTAGSLEAQDFRALGTRRGAVIGGIIGGIVGHQNDEALAGIAIGGLVGGATGRVIGNRMDYQYSQAYQQGFSNGYYQPQTVYSQPIQGTVYAQPTYVQPTYVQPTYVQPVYGHSYVPQPTYYPQPSCRHYSNGVWYGR